jgi:hypothetical protein
MLELVAQLDHRLTVNGVLAFTFIDPHFNPARANGKVHPGYYDGSNLRQRLESQKDNEPNIDAQLLMEKARYAAWCTLVNDDDLYIETDKLIQYEKDEKRSFCTFYTAEYMKGIFPDAAVLAPTHSAYDSTEEAVLQHCCVIRKASR